MVTYTRGEYSSTKRKGQRCAYAHGAHLHFFPCPVPRHDQGWKEREVFGKIRYMNLNGRALGPRPARARKCACAHAIAHARRRRARARVCVKRESVWAAAFGALPRRQGIYGRGGEEEMRPAFPLERSPDSRTCRHSRVSGTLGTHFRVSGC